jgi:hypothetical protein
MVMNPQNKESSKIDVSHAIKKIMTSLYFILKEEPQRNDSFTSSREMEDKLEAYFRRFAKSEKSHYNGEILEHFTSAINEMNDMGIILYDDTDPDSPVLIVKEKLIQQIAHM